MYVEVLIWKIFLFSGRLQMRYSLGLVMHAEIKAWRHVVEIKAALWTTESQDISHRLCIIQMLHEIDLLSQYFRLTIATGYSLW